MEKPRMSRGYSTRSKSLDMESMLLLRENRSVQTPWPGIARPTVRRDRAQRQPQKLLQPRARRRDAHHRRIGCLPELARARLGGLGFASVAVQDIVGDLKCQAEIFAVARQARQIGAGGPGDERAD